MNQMRLSNDLTNQPAKSAHSARESLISMISKVKGSSANANDLKNLNAEERVSIASQLMKSKHSPRALKAIFGEQAINGIDLANWQPNL